MAKKVDEISEQAAASQELLSFELKSRDGLARIGKIKTKHGYLDTPTLLPVINPNDQEISASEMRKLFGTQGVITNSYIIYKTEALHEPAVKEGVHRLIDFDGPIMTDSGTFQLYTYGKVSVKPQEIIEFQNKIKPDIGTILDVFGTPERTHAEAQSDVAETLSRAADAVKLKGPIALAGTVQGGIYPDLREHCATELSKLPFDVHPIGGIVPIIGEYQFTDLVKIIIASKTGLDPSRPVHLFGAGHPLIFPLAVALGCDMFDSASYIKYAHDNRLLFPDGTKKLEQLEHLPCLCPICNDTSVAELRSLDVNERSNLLAKHNLYVCFNELVRVKDAIAQGTLWELVEQRARAHPHMLHSLSELYKNYTYLEQFEPISRRRFLYVGPESMQRPEIIRFQNRVKSGYVRPKTNTIVCFPEPGNRTKSLEEHFRIEIQQTSEITNSQFVFQTIFGPVPIEFDGTYPFGQTVIDPDLARSLIEQPEVFRRMEQYAHRLDSEFSIIWDGEETLENIKMLAEPRKGDGLDLDVARIRAITDYQFGSGAADIILGKVVDLKLEFVRSKNTGKIRNIISDNEHVLSLRAGDGLFTLKAAGARRLHSGFPSPKLRVQVIQETAEFNQQGKNVFSKFIISCDTNLRPGDEVLVTDEQDELVAIGRMILTNSEMLAFNTGIAVRVREGIDNP